MTTESQKPHLAVYADSNHFADVEMPEAEFIAAVRGALPGCTRSDDQIASVLDDVQSLLGKALGQFNWSGYRTPRSVLAARIKQLEHSLAAAADILASSGHNRTKEDSDVLSFIAKVGAPSASEVAAANQEIATCRESISAMLARTRRAKKQFESLNGAGNPPLLWYEPIVEASILIAMMLEVPLVTAGDRSTNPYETPFTWLTFHLEQFLPKEMRSDQLSGCAKRIQRSAAWRRVRQD